MKLRKPASRWLGRAGAVFGAAAVVHVAALLTQGGSWAGAISFHKPITFSISFGLLLWTCGWIFDRGVHPQHPVAKTELLADLTGREREALELMARGLSNQELAERLFIAVNTVKLT